MLLAANDRLGWEHSGPARKERLVADTTEAGGQAGADAGCRVDWSWLEGREIAAASSSLDKLIITFRDGETLTVQAAIWKGEPFLAFTPWKAPAGP